MYCRPCSMLGPAMAPKKKLTALTAHAEAKTEHDLDRVELQGIHQRLDEKLSNASMDLIDKVYANVESESQCLLSLVRVAAASNRLSHKNGLMLFLRRRSWLCASFVAAS